MNEDHRSKEMDTDLFLRMKNQQGVISVVVALLMIVLLGAAAFAIDIGHLYLVRSELQNAADAGCLAAARFLYYEDGPVNEGANQIAYDAALVNKSDQTPVEVQWSGGNEGDVERGHWNFATKTFTTNSSTQPVNPGGKSDEDLDNDPNFINAVRVRTRRQDTPAASFFAGIFGHENFSLSTEAIAYIGFAGTLAPGDSDEPIAVCKQSLLASDKYSCATGRVIYTEGDLPNLETGAWTDFNQDDPCPSGTNDPTVVSLVSSGGNPDPIIVGQNIATEGGNIGEAFKRLIQSWELITGKTRPWTLTLPVIECPGNNVSKCGMVVGAVTINIVWVLEDGSEAPWVMRNPLTGGIWFSLEPDDKKRWTNFATAFNLRRMDGTLLTMKKRSIYFLPDCNLHQRRGRTGGENFGIMAKIPVLAK